MLVFLFGVIVGGVGLFLLLAYMPASTRDETARVQAEIDHLYLRARAIMDQTITPEWQRFVQGTTPEKSDGE